MTIIEQIKAEIERLKKEELTRNSIGVITGSAFFVSANELLSFLSTLESEKPMNQDELEEEINRYFEPIHAADIQFEPFTQMTKCARHFAEWGAEHLRDSTKMVDKGLEEAADNHIHEVVDAAGHPGWDWTTQDVADAFIAGAKWQAEQLLKSSPLPEDTVLFNKGVEEGKRLMMEEAVSVIESRLSEIIGDAQPKPILRAELQELIKRIKDEK